MDKIGDGVLEDLEEEIIRKQKLEEDKLKQQQRENEKRLQMLKYLNKIKKEKMMRKDCNTLES